jgi:hypothetical protein
VCDGCKHDFGNISFKDYYDETSVNIQDKNLEQYKDIIRSIFDKNN